MQLQAGGRRQPERDVFKPELLAPLTAPVICQPNFVCSRHQIEPMEVLQQVTAGQLLRIHAHSDTWGTVLRVPAWWSAQPQVHPAVHALVAYDQQTAQRPSRAVLAL